MDFRFLAAYAFASALLLIAPLAGVASTSIPFTTEDGMIRVAASIDDGTSRPMLIDLGAGVDVLSSVTARSLNVKIDDVFTAWRMSGDRMDSPVGTIQSLTVGPLRVVSPWVMPWDGFDGHGIDGLISATEFRNAPVTFDYARHVLKFEDATSLATRVANAQRVPLFLQDDRGISLGLFALFDFGHGQSGLCEIDTGSQGFFLNERFVAKLGFDAKATTGRIDSIALHGAPQTAIARPRVRFKSLIYDCNVGNDFWNDRSFTLDIPDRALYV